MASPLHGPGGGSVVISAPVPSGPGPGRAALFVHYYTSFWIVAGANSIQGASALVRARRIVATMVDHIERSEIVARRGDPAFVLVDVLPRASYEEGHLPGALNLPVAEIETRAGEVLPDRAADIAVYCASDT